MGRPHKKRYVAYNPGVCYFKPRGIPLVAGSDAHHPDQVGRYFDKLPGLLKTLL